MAKYDVILADPPWFYNNRKTGGERKNKTRFGGGAMKHYPLMRDKDLLAMADWVKSLSSDNCALFMWSTRPRKDFAIDLLKAWGFRYTTEAFNWVKVSPKTKRLIYGPGYYTASNPEDVLLGIKGSMPPVVKMVPSVIIAPRLEHSRKPQEVYRRIEKMYPNARKLELFARRPKDGWDVWGNEVESTITMEGGA